MSSPTLTIKRTLTDTPIGQMKLTLSDQEFPLIRLRFPIARAAAIFVKNNSQGTNLDDTDIQRLNDFLAARGPNDDTNQRRRAAVPKGQNRILAEVRLLLDPAVEEFTEFHDLEDEDHDDEEGRTSWGPEDDVDECDD
ncbi:expressed unknown protein [Seminavis robusta]|uniref:Uncharacterized protein n=1 Tax=Seminavis robusta TaxID=568900 RepID=A0A9N8EEI2_9STRA|nr:expressed unknown protein [Seminavis robusta]|eukprot:Sro1063_g237180.1 n/a (138) ;mRNA; f:37495-37969